MWASIGVHKSSNHNIDLVLGKAFSDMTPKKKKKSMIKKINKLDFLKF